MPAQPENPRSDKRAGHVIGPKQSGPSEVFCVNAARARLLASRRPPVDRGLAAGEPLGNSPNDAGAGSQGLA